jgi:putative ABC transport system ATP-binding protein
VNRDLAATVVLVTHNAPIARMADRVVTLADGLIVRDVRNERCQSSAEVSW